MVFCHNTKVLEREEEIMGAWGTGPYENDDAGDFKDSLRKDTPPSAFIRIFKEAARRIPSPRDMKKVVDGRRGGLHTAGDFYLEARAAAKMVADSKTGGELNALAIRALENMVRDEGWLETWDEPKVVCNMIRREIADLRRIR